MGEEIVVVSADRIIPVEGANSRNSLDYSKSEPVSSAMLRVGELCQGPSLSHIADHCSFHVVYRDLIQYGYCRRDKSRSLQR